MSDCLFCRILRREIPAKFIYQDEEVTAFADLNPQAPTHCLVIPNLHLSTLNEIDAGNQALAGKLIAVAVQIAKDEGLSEKGYRLVANCQAAAGQSVFHVHFHLMGGRSFDWPPG